jgi:succinyl-diaminopimelate desuccinylase
MKNINEIIDKNKNIMIDSLINLIDIPSISNDLISVKKALNYCINLGKELGFNTKILNNEQIGIIEFGEGEETLGILVHIDVVPPGDISLWKTDPFKGTLFDNKVFGRGSIDDKGPFISVLYALKSVVDYYPNFKKKVQIIIGTQEEVEWTDMKEFVKNNKLPDYGFTPDGEFPVCNIEKGFCDLKFKIPFENEIGVYKLKSITAGHSENTIPNEAVAILDKDNEIIEIKAVGKSAHSSIPSNGTNAFTKLLIELDKLELENNNKIIDFLLKISNSQDCSIFDLKTISQYFNGEFVHSNTCSITLVNTEDKFLNININFRHTYPTTCNELIEKVENVIHKHGGQLVSKLCEEPIFISKDMSFLKIFNESYERQTGDRGGFALAYGGSYAKAMDNIVSWGPIFPNGEDLCHEENEFIDVDKMTLMTKIYADSIFHIVSNDEKYSNNKSKIDIK